MWVLTCHGHTLHILAILRDAASSVLGRTTTVDFNCVALLSPGD